jgi:hypothetical protein
LLRAAFFPHLLDVSERREVLVGYLDDHQIAAISFLPKATYSHSAEGERELDRIFQPERRVEVGLLRGWLGRGHQAALALTV